MSLKSIIVVAVLFSGAFGLGASQAISKAMGFDGWFGLEGESAPVQKESSTLETLESELDLGHDQRKRFHHLRSYCNCELRSCRLQIDEARQNLVEAMLAEPPDAAWVEQARKELLIAYEACQGELISKFLEATKGMNPEQKKKLAEAFFPERCAGGAGCGKGRCGKGARSCAGKDKK